MGLIKDPIILLAFIVAVSSAWASEPELVSPSATDPLIQQMTGPHVVLHPKGASQGRLFITLGGTNSRPEDFLEMQQLAAAMGYHVVGIDYPNNVITTVCRESPNHSCFDQFRSEIALGIDGSQWVTVNPANCIARRIVALMDYLRAKDKGGGWDQFFSDGSLAWDRVVIAGHSQGSGHAAFLSKVYPFARVIMLSGPQDTATWGTAAWLGEKGSTPPDRYFAFLHAGDSFGSFWQLRALSYLVRGSDAELLNIEDEVPRGSHSQILVSHLPMRNAHMAPVSSRFKKVWAYLLRRKTRD